MSPQVHRGALAEAVPHGRLFAFGARELQAITEAYEAVRWPGGGCKG
jgi:hypothetical protein